MDELFLLRERGDISAEEHRRRVDQALQRALLLSEARRAQWGRVGVISAVVWIALGFGLAFLSSSLGAPQLSGWLALLAGPASLLVVGRRHGLHRAGDWLLAGAIALAIGWVGAGLAACLGAMAMYG